LSMQILGLILSLLIGFVLGLIGGGGAILTVPLLEYCFGQTTYAATTYSLMIVSIAALFGVIQRMNKGLFALREATIFVIPSMLVAFGIRILEIPEFIAFHGKIFSRDELISYLLVIVMIFIALRLFFPKKKENLEVVRPTVLSIVLLGMLTGAMSGFLGAGGGFIIVPILLGLGLDMKRAVATSMLIVTFQSAIALSGDFIHKIGPGVLVIDYKLVALLSALTIIGVYIGTILQRKVSGQFLRRMFATILLTVAIGVLIDHFV